MIGIVQDGPGKDTVTPSKVFKQTAENHVNFVNREVGPIDLNLLCYYMY